MAGSDDGADAVDELLALADGLRHPRAQDARGHVEQADVAHVGQVDAEEAGEHGGLWRARVDRLLDHDRPARPRDRAQIGTASCRRCAARAGKRAEIACHQARRRLAVDVAHHGHLDGRGGDQAPEPRLRGIAADRLDLLGGQRLGPRLVLRIDGVGADGGQHLHGLTLPRGDALQLAVLPLLERGRLDDGVGEQQVGELEPPLELGGIARHGERQRVARSSRCAPAPSPPSSDRGSPCSTACSSPGGPRRAAPPR